MGAMRKRKQGKCLVRSLTAGALCMCLTACAAEQVPVDRSDLAAQGTSAVSTQRAGETVYFLGDTLYDDDAFSAFRQDPDRVNSVGDFYNRLTQSPSLTVLSAFYQPVSVRDFQGDAQFYYHSQEFVEANQDSLTDMPVKTLQINQQAYAYYGLQTQNGYQFPWADIRYEQDQIVPVVLGPAYQGTYAIGDRFTGEFYGRWLQFEVADFLQEGATATIQNGETIELQTYVVVPYPQQCWTVDPEDFTFESILYFAMINCLVVSSETPDALQTEVAQIASAAGFSDFSLTARE